MEHSRDKDNKRLRFKDAIVLLESSEESSIQDVMEAWALLIRTGRAWKLTENYSSYADALIEGGIISRDGLIINYETIEKINQQEEPHEERDSNSPETITPETEDQATIAV